MPANLGRKSHRPSPCQRMDTRHNTIRTHPALTTGNHALVTNRCRCELSLSSSSLGQTSTLTWANLAAAWPIHLGSEWLITAITGRQARLGRLERLWIGILFMALPMSTFCWFTIISTQSRVAVAPAGVANDSGYKEAQQDAAQWKCAVTMPLSHHSRYQTLKPCTTTHSQSCAFSNQAHTAMSAFLSQSDVDTFTLGLSVAEYYPTFFPSNGEGIRTLGVSFTRVICASCSLTYLSICRESSVKGALQRGRKFGSLKAPTAQSAAPQPRAMITTTTTLRDSDIRTSTVQVLVFLQVPGFRLLHLD